MADQEYREIQLSGKQIVFLFMSLVVVAVVIFLLGVSVGRGVRGPESVETAQGAAPGDTIGTVTPPPTQTNPGDLKYHSMLQGQPPSGGAANPAPAEPPATPPTTEPVPKEPQPPPGAAPPEAGRGTAAPPQQQQQQQPPPPQPPAAQTRSGGARSSEPATPAAAKSGGWMVQVGAFKSRENAESLVAQLKRRGHAAVIIRSTAPNAPHLVRVGPFADRAAADKAAAALAREQGVGKPSVTR
jgi:cell division septation protein DedD